MSYRASYLLTEYNIKRMVAILQLSRSELGRPDDSLFVESDQTPPTIFLEKLGQCIIILFKFCVLIIKNGLT